MENKVLDALSGWHGITGRLPGRWDKTEKSIDNALQRIKIENPEAQMP